MGICSFSFTGAIIPWLKSSSICSQILEHIIYSNIMNHLSQNNLLSDNHHGFRARRSCETQLITTVQELAKNMSSGKQIDAILLDLSKAFDRVPHRRLLMKLDHYGIRGTTLKWIQDFLIGRTQQVLLDGTHSSICDVDSGVPKTRYSAHCCSSYSSMTCPNMSHQMHDYSLMIASSIVWLTTTMTSINYKTTYNN